MLPIMVPVEFNNSKVRTLVDGAKEWPDCCALSLKVDIVAVMKMVAEIPVKIYQFV